MIPREAHETPAAATASARRAETLVKPKSKEFNPSTTTVIDIPSAVAKANVATAAVATTASAAVVLNVCSNLGGTCTHPAHYYVGVTLPPPPPPPSSSPPALLIPTYAAAGVGVGTGGVHALDAMTSTELRANMEAVNEKKYRADYQRCCPPPMFIILISLLEIGVFVYDYVTVRPQHELNSTTIPSESVLIYRPDRRLEIWRFVSYMVLHANWFHLGFNVVIQLLYGLPLEMVHGSLRIAVIYLAGVFAGSLGTSVVDSEVYLVGASGGVYALLAAQLANILLNFGQMRYGISQLVSVVIFVSCDLGYALYSKYIAEEAKAIPSVSYIAHLTGSLAGFTMGLLILRNFENNKAQSNLIWWLALGVYSAFTIFAIVFNLINTVTAQMLEEEGEVIKQHLLHDLGIS